MTSSHQAAASALAVVRPEVIRILDRVLAVGCAEPPVDAGTLAALADPVRQAAAALRLAGSDAAAVCMNAMAATLVAPESVNAPQYRDLLCDAWNDFTNYLREASNSTQAAAGFYPLYAAFQTGLGVTPAPGDLLFPAPLAVSPRSAATALDIASVQDLRTLRTDYEQGLLEWLRGNRAGLARMQTTLAAMAALHSPQQRFWQDTLGLITALIDDSLEGGRDIKILLGQLSREIRQAGTSAHLPSPTLHRTILLCTVSSTSQAPEVRDVIEFYRWDALLAAADAPATRSDEASRILLRKVGSATLAWKAFVHGKNTALSGLADAASALHAHAQATADTALSELWSRVLSLCQSGTALTRELAGEIDIEMTCALEITALLLRGSADTTVLASQMLSLAERLRLAAYGEVPTNTMATAWSQQVSPQETALRRQRLLHEMTREIGADLQHIEQQIDDVLRAPEHVLDSGNCRQRFARIAGALHMLQLEEMAGLSRVCMALLDAEPVVDQLQTMAEIICGMQWYLDRLLTDDPQAVAVLEPLLAQHGIAMASARAAVVEISATTEAQDFVASAAIEVSEEVSEPVAIDALPDDIMPAIPAGAPSLLDSFHGEIVGIFLEETGEILATIASVLAEGRSQPIAGEGLSTLRRAFHTLKGSGRAARLPQIGDAAACFEQVLDQAIHRGGFRHEALFDLVEYAHLHFLTWTQALQLGQTPAIDLAAVTTQIEQHCEHLYDTAPAVASIVDMTVASTPPVDSDQNLRSDTRSLSTEISQLFLGEASEYLVTLQGAAQDFAAGVRPMPAAIRAAHTLAGIAHAVKLPPLSELAVEIEHWLEQQTLTTTVADAASVDLLQRGVEALTAMVGSVEHKQVPEPVEDLVREIRAAVEQQRHHAQAAATPALADWAELPLPAGEDVDPDLIHIFLREAFDMEAELAQVFEHWRQTPADTEPVQAIARALHTLKGGARAVGLLPLGDSAHQIETRLLRWTPDDETAHQTIIAEIRDDFDAWYSELGQVEARYRERAVPPPTGIDETATPNTEATPVLAKQEAMLRISAASLDRMLRTVGEAAITRSATENDVASLGESLVYLNESVERLRLQVREIEIEAEKQVQARSTELAASAADFDPLEFDRYTRLQELARLIAESIHDVNSMQQNNLRMAEDARDSLEREARLNLELRTELTRIRAMPFATALPRLQRIVRQTARTLGKEASLTVRGQQTEFDKTVLERLLPPLEHMLRNALVHGIEPSAERLATGKPASGEVSITIQQDVDSFVVIVRDDGRGLDFERIRLRAVALEWLPETATPSPEELMELIFLPAFSTSSQITEVAGRGVGLDVVRSAITALGGSVTIESVPGQHTSFRIYVPLTVWLVNVLLVRAGSTLHALPANLVTLVRTSSEAEWEKVMAAGYDQWLGNDYPLAYLPHLLGEIDSAIAPVRGRGSKLLLLDGGDQRLALQVDEIIGRQELAVKETGPQLQWVPGAKGASILGDDQIVLILNPLLLAAHRQAAPVRDAAPMVEVRPRIVMVVDDSITVRKITGRLLARAGYQMVPAKDGMEAIELLANVTPDAMLLDIEMPRMDGFEVTRRVRNMPAFAQLPILVVTSRTAEKHREYALSLGATRYIGKPYDEEALLQDLEQCIAAAHAFPAAVAGGF